MAQEGMVSIVHGIMTYVVSQQSRDGSTVYSEFETELESFTYPQISNIHLSFLQDYKLACNIIAFGILRIARMSKSEISERFKSVLNVPADVEPILKKVIGLDSFTLNYCSALLGVKFNVINFDDSCKQQDVVYEKLANMFDTVGTLYNFTPENVSKVSVHKSEVDSLFDRLKLIVERNELSSPYGVMYYRESQGYFLRPTTSENSEFYPFKLNYFADYKRGIIPSTVTEENNISQLFTEYLCTSEPGEFIFYDSNSGSTVNIPENGGKVKFYPIFIASLIFRQKMHCKQITTSDGKNGVMWYLDPARMKKDDYIEWLSNFFYNRMMPAVIGSIPVEKYSTIWQSVTRSLTSYVYLEDYKGVAKVSLIFSFGEKSKDISIRCKAISDKILDISNGAFGSSLFPGKTLEKIDSRFLSQSSQDYSGYIISFTADKTAYYALTSFAYKTYAQMMENNKEISLKSLFVGKTKDDQLLSVDLSGNTTHSMYITAGSRSGKGVLTLNLLAGLIYSGCPLIYLDNKPDMASMLWQMERELNNGVVDINSDGTANPNYKRILSIESLRPTKKFPKDDNNVLGFNSTRVKLAYQRAQANCPSEFRTLTVGAKAFISYVKAVQLAFVVAQYPSTFGVNQDAKLVTIMDELNNATESLDVWVDTFGLSKAYKDLKYTLPEKFKGTPGAKFFELLNDLTSSWNLGRNAWFTDTGGALFIEIAQKLSAGGNTSGGGKTVTKSFMANMIQWAPYKIFGKNGNMKTGVDKADMTAFTTNNEDGRTSAYNEVQGAGGTTDKATGEELTALEGCSRRFIFTSDNGYRVFAPLFTLNRNDLLLATESIAEQTISGNPPIIDDALIHKIATNQRWAKSNVGPFLDIQESNHNDPETVIKAEIVEKQQDGSYSLNEKIGFMGLLRMLLNYDNTKILNTLSRGYDICWEILTKSGIAQEHGYTFVEEYLYDLRPDTIYSSSEIVERMQSGLQTGSSTSSFNTGDFNNSGYDGYANPTQNSGMSEPSDMNTEDNTVDAPMGNTSETTTAPLPNPFQSSGNSWGTQENSGETLDPEGDWDNSEFDDGTEYNYNSQETTGQPVNGFGAPTGAPMGAPQPVPPAPNYSGIPTYDKPFVPEDLELSFGDGVYGGYNSVRHYSEVLVECIREAMGDLNRVTKFEVQQGGHIVVNGVHIAPTLKQSQLEALPLDIRGRVSQGMWIDIFHFTDLYKFKNLSYLSVDDLDLAYTKLRTEIGKPTFLKIKNKLARKTSLETLVIAGQVIDETPESAEQQTINENSHNFSSACKNGFGKLASVGSALGHACGRIYSSKVWQSPVGRFAKGAAVVAGVGIGLSLMGSILGLLGVWGTLNLALAGGGGLYNAIRKRKK